MAIRTQRRGTEVVARLSGDLDLNTADEIRTILDHHIDAGCRHIVLYLQDVAFIDSSGIGVILGRIRRLREVGGRMTIVRARPHVRRLLEFSGLGGLLSFDVEGVREREQQ